MGRRNKQRGDHEGAGETKTFILRTDLSSCLSEKRVLIFLLLVTWPWLFLPEPFILFDLGPAQEKSKLPSTSLRMSGVINKVFIVPYKSVSCFGTLRFLEQL